MSYRLRYSQEALEDIERLYSYLIEKGDLKLADRAYRAILRGADVLREFPFSCRKAQPGNALLRELLIPFGAAGYVALFEIEDGAVTILALRHQREDDYH